MKRLYFRIILLVLAIAAPVAAKAEVSVNIGIGFPPPPPVVYPAPPEVVVLPDTDDVYVVPSVNVDLFFWNGWWWRPWEGRWYRSHYYDRGWVYYNYVPRFYYDVDPHWRTYYGDHDWYGRPWHYEPIPHQQLQRNWKGWHDSRHWERQGTWGVQGYHPRPPQERQDLRRQRTQEYLGRPEVQRHQQQVLQQRQQQQRQQMQRRQPERLPQGQQSPRYQQPHQQSQPRGRQEGREAQHQKREPERGNEERR